VAVLPECLFEELVEVADAARHGAHVDQVEEIRGPCPGGFGVVDFESDVGRDPGCVSRCCCGEEWVMGAYQVGCIGLRSVAVTVLLASIYVSNILYIPVAPGNTSPASMAHIPVPVPMSRICCGSWRGAKTILSPKIF
jgi:hypothetical protein